MTIPPNLLTAVAHPGGGRISIIVGAGCSTEEPTNLLLARDLSIKVHRQLVLDTILEEGECPDREDLSCVADTVYKKCDNSQTELVRRLPLSSFKNAEPNQGHLIAAALLREQALLAILTLNFDLAISHALATMGATEEVSVVSGIEEHDQLGAINLVYLHGNATMPDGNAWILRTEQLEEAWRNGWQELITTRIATTPNVIFAGLGSPTTVLTETVRKIRNALGNQINISLVDPSADSAFATDLGPEASHIQLGWCEFMERLGARLVEENLSTLDRTCQEVGAENNFQEENIESLLDQIKALALLGFGQLRSRWVPRHAHSQYVPARGFDWRHFADLLLCLGLIQRIVGAEASLSKEGIVILTKDAKTLCRIIPLSGEGSRRFTALEPRIEAINKDLKKEPQSVLTVFLLAAVPDSTNSIISVPRDLVDGEDVSDIIVGDSDYIIWDVDRLRSEPGQLAVDLRYE